MHDDYMPKSLVTVVIPIHLEEPTELEKISLAQTLAVLHRHPITFMTPVGLNVAWYETFCQGKAQIYFERFRWKGRNEFCALLCSPNFYRQFARYEYMLICHLDAFVFRDELTHWCQLGYDYIGAVIYNRIWLNTSRMRALLGFDYPEYMGNGGFALKKVSSFYQMTSKFKWYIDFYIWVWRKRKAEFLDDIFLAQHFPKLSSEFKIAPKSLAQKFAAAYEQWDEQDLPFTNENNENLPFGTHGWILCHQDFWKPCIQRYGHVI